MTVTVSGGKCVFETNAIPNHDFNDGGRFATNVSAQNVRYEMTSFPEAASSVTELILGDNAIFLNGVKLDLLAAACYGVGREQLGREKIGCGQDEIDNPWRYDPMSPLNEFGPDNNNATSRTAPTTITAIRWRCLKVTANPLFLRHRLSVLPLTASRFTAAA